MSENERARALAAALTGIAAALIVGLLAAHVKMPQLWYLPLERAWAFGAKPEGLVMAWYGRVLWMLIAGVVAGAAGAMIRPLHGSRGTSMLCGVALVLGVSSTVQIVISNLERETIPLPLPLP